MTAMKPAARLSNVQPSLIRAMNRGAPPGCVQLGLGEPGWGFPIEGMAALAISRRDCSYGPNAGLPELNKALSEFYGIPSDGIMVGAGSQAVLFALFAAWLEPGDAVLVPDPGFVSYRVLASLAGASTVPYPLAKDGSFDPDGFLSALASCQRPKLAVLNHPSNPTGGGCGENGIKVFCRSCEKFGVIAISDEAYRELYLDSRGPSLLGAGSHCITVGSISKAWAAPGLRVGWALGMPELLEPARLLHAYMNTAPARPSQEAATAMIRASASILPKARAELATRWETLTEALKAELGHEATTPAGGFYYWLPLPEAAKGDPVGFCQRLRDERGVIVIPGLAFGERGRGHVRLSFAGSPEAIIEGIKRLSAAWRKA